MEVVSREGERLVMGAVAPALCLDLDGTIRYSKSGGFISSPEDIALFDGVEEVLWKWRNDGFLILGVSNQGGVAFGYKTPEQDEAEVCKTMELFKNNPFHWIKTCFHHPEGTVAPFNRCSLFRKPMYGMLALYEFELFQEGWIVDWPNSIFVGDREEDRLCAINAGLGKFFWANRFFGRFDPSEGN